MKLDGGSRQVMGKTTLDRGEERNSDFTGCIHMIRVMKEICLGCGVCAQSCPQGAILFFLGQAEINQNKCNSCGMCLDVCPQGAIVESVPVSREALAGTVTGLRQQADDLLARIERLKHKKRHRMPDVGQPTL